MLVKETVKQVVDNLPDNATLDDIIHALYVKAKFDHGLDDAKQHGGTPHADVKKRFEKWLK